MNINKSKNSMAMCIFNIMGSVQTMVCVRQVKQELPEEWDESMPLPGDIIEGFAEAEGDDMLFLPARGRSELSSLLGKISPHVEAIWVKVRRGESVLNLRVRVVTEKSSMLNRKFTIRAAKDDRHIAILGDLTLEQCTELQEMSRSVVNMDNREFNKKGVKYDWKLKVGTYLPDQRSTVISSILFMPLSSEHNIESTTARSMAWFSAAVSSGAPLVFVNIQSEQIVTSEKARDINWCKSSQNNTTFQLVNGIRIWFLPGVTEVLLELIPLLGEARFGMDIKRTDEGFISVCSVTKGSAADRVGLKRLHDEANESGNLLIISRLEGKSLMPSRVSSGGLIHCCDHNEIKDTLVAAIDGMDSAQLHIMAWPNQTRICATPSPTTQGICAATLKPPTAYQPM